MGYEKKLLSCYGAYAYISMKKIEVTDDMQA